MESIASKQASLFPDKSIIITGIKRHTHYTTLYVNDINHFVKQHIYNGHDIITYPEFHDALNDINAGEFFETGYEIQMSNLNDIKAHFSKFGITIFTRAEAMSLLQSHGYMTGDESTLSDDGWYEQLELALNDSQIEARFKDTYSYDYNLMPSHLKNSKTAAFIYAISGVYNDIVIQSGILSDKDIVIDIICNAYTYSKLTSILQHVDPSIMQDIDITIALMKLGCNDLAPLPPTDPRLNDSRIIDAISGDKDIRWNRAYALVNYPNLRNDKSKERQILSNILKRDKDTYKLTDAQIDNMSDINIIDKLKTYILDGATNLSELPDWMRDDADIAIYSNVLTDVSPRLQSDATFIAQYCNLHPYAVSRYPHLLANNPQLMLRVIKENCLHEIKNWQQIIIQNNYLQNKDIKIALIEQRDYTLDKEPNCDDKDIALAALEVDVNAYQYLSDRLKHDTDILKSVDEWKLLDEWMYFVPDDIIPTIQTMLSHVENMNIQNEYGCPRHDYIEWSAIPAKLLNKEVAIAVAKMSYTLAYSGYSHCRLSNIPKQIQLTTQDLQKLLADCTDMLALMDIIKDISTTYPAVTGTPEYADAIARYSTFQQDIDECKDIYNADDDDDDNDDDSTANTNNTTTN